MGDFLLAFHGEKNMVRRVGGLVNTEQVRKHLRAKGQAHKCSPNTAFFLRIPAHAQETLMQHNLMHNIDISPPDLSILCLHHQYHIILQLS